nr:MAG TPA: 43 kDa tail protein [Caudoviricetes sp.]
MIRVEAIIDDSPYIISAFCSNIKREDDIKSLGVKLSFDYLNNKVIDKNTVWIDLSLGTTILLYDDDDLLFQGTIQKATRNGLATYQYDVFDHAWYLNKQEARIQFNNVDVKTAIETLCKQENIPYDVACDIPTKVTKIYNGDTISKIIDDLLKLATNENGKRYRREYNYGKLYINTFDNLKMIWKSEPLVSDFSQEFNCDKLANKIVIMSGKEKSQSVVATAEDKESQKKFGLYVHYEKVDDKKKAKAQNIANNKLKQMAWPTKATKVTLLGDNYVRSGRILKFNQPNINMVGEYLVTNCSHSYDAGKHTMDCELILDKEVNNNV